MKFSSNKYKYISIELLWNISEQALRTQAAKAARQYGSVWGLPLLEEADA